jgi:TonB family protein
MNLATNNDAAVAFMVAWTVKATVLLGLAWIATLAVRRRSAALRHRIWAIAIVASLLLPIVSTALPAWHVIPAAAKPSHPQVTVIITSNAPPSTADATPARHDWDAAATLRAALFIWAAFAAFFLLRLVAGLMQLSRISAYARTIADGDTAALLANLTERFGFRRKVRLLLSPDAAAMPMTWGIFRPRIILPASAPGWTAERRRIVLSHEFAHIARCDWLFQICGETLRAFFWYHPAAWLAANRLRQESERACDDAVLSCGIAAQDYASELLALTQSLKAAEREFSIALAFARNSNLERRFEAMLNASIHRGPVSRKKSSLLALCAACLLLPLAALTLSAAPPSSAYTMAPAAAAPGSDPTPPPPAAEKSAKQLAAEGPVRVHGALPSESLPRDVSTDAARAVFQRECSTCHSSDDVSGMNLTADQWTGELNKMVQLGASIDAQDFATIRDYLALNFGPKPAPQPSPATGSAEAQPQSAASISGVIKDPSGAIIVGAAVELTNQSTPNVPSGAAVTGPMGQFSFPNLVPGPYLLKVTQTGFKAYSQLIQLAPSEILNLHDIALSVGDVAQVVTVNPNQTAAGNATANCTDAVATPVADQQTPPASDAGQSAAPQRVSVGGNVQAPRVVCSTPPIYPQVAREAKVQGTVTMHAIIGKNGSVISLQFVSGPTLLMKAAMDAVKNWRYTPMLLNGQPVEVDTEISVGFHLY